MSYYDKNWLYNEYISLYKNHIGGDPLEEEKRFLKEYCNPFNEEGAKKIYYMAIFRLKRGWYISIVFLFIIYSLKKDFLKNANLHTLVKLRKIYANKMLNDAIKAYCKISD